MPRCRKKKNSVDQGRSRVQRTPSSNSVHRAAIRQQPLSWSNIPATALCKIYHNLSDMDRSSLAQVCKAYCEVFRTPSLWRQRFIEFDKPKIKEQIEMETLFRSETGLSLSSGKCGISFAKRFRNCLQDLDICVKTTYPVSREVLSDFRTLSENLDGANLTTLKITYPGLLSLESTRRQQFIKPLHRLLRHQNSLKSFAIYLPYLDIGIGLNFLSCLAQSSGNTLEKLWLKNLFMSIHIHRDGRLVTEMQKFKHIRSVAMDYAILSEELVEIWAQGYPTLSYLKLWAAQTGHQISSQAWKNLKATHPGLLVGFLVQKFESTDQMLPALSPAMPVCKLIWESEHEVTSEFQELFGRLALLVSRKVNNEAFVDADITKWNWKGRRQFLLVFMNLTNILHRVASYEKTIKYLFVKINGEEVTLDTLSVQILLSNCRKLLPFTCKNFSHPLTERDTWILSQDSGLRPQEDI